jgi:hypothetical protein
VTTQELDAAIDQAVAFMKELLPLLDGVKKLRRKKPDETMIDPSDEMLDIYRQLRKANREKFLLDRRIELLESKIQLVISENRGMTDVASWKWNDCWKMTPPGLRRKIALCTRSYVRSISAIQAAANFAWNELTLRNLGRWTVERGNPSGSALCLGGQRPDDVRLSRCGVGCAGIR